MPKKLKGLEHSHHPSAIKNRLLEGQSPNYLKDIVYGGVDGTITTFAIVSGVAGAGMEASVVVILGVANVLADGFSMAASNFMAHKAEAERHHLLETYETKQIHHDPVGETEEVKQILKLKGFTGDTLENATQVYVQDKKRWVELMLGEEYGITKSNEDPLHSALATFLSFCLFGAIPLLPYLLKIHNSYVISCSLTSVCFFAIGSFKSRWSLKAWWSSGLQTLILGTIAALVAYYIGYFLEKYV